MKNKIFIFASLLVLIFAFQNFTVPEFPSRNIDTVTAQKIDGEYQSITPHVPMLDYTQDGRIAILRRGGNALYALTPEKVIGHLQNTNNPNMGANLIRRNHDFKFDANEHFGVFKNESIGANMKRANTLICEKTEAHTNPTVCTDDATRDCYTVTLVTFYKQNHDSQRTLHKIAAMDVSFSVIHPKTRNARIDPSSFSVNPRSFKVSPGILSKVIAEPVIAGDGRLLVQRFGFRPASLLNEDGTTETPLTTANHDIVYSTYPATHDQCDPSQWTQFHPISHAHHDEENKMRARYKFARYQLRDSLGNLIPDRAELGGSYPWMDKNAANLFFTSFGEDTFYNLRSQQVITPFPEKPKSDTYFTLINIEDFNSYRSVLEGGLAPVVGYTMAGFWTHGKMVVLDGQINNADYAFRVSDRQREDGTIINTRRELNLYRKTPRNQEYESVGAVRELGTYEPTTNLMGSIMLEDYHKQLSQNSTFMGSLENRLNYNKNVFPVTPRDIVWHFGSTRHTEEFVFDDYNSPYFLINAEMTAPVTKKSALRLHHYTGFKNGVAQSPAFDGFPRTLAGFPPLVQNTATAPDDFMRVPYYGKIIGSSRIEPIAKGGIHGKGLWLAPTNSVAFQIPAQPNNTSFDISRHKKWYIGIFIDPRGPVDRNRDYALFSLGSIQVALKKTQDGAHLYDQISFRNGENTLATKSIPAELRIKSDVWRHISLVTFKNKLPEIYLDGFSIGRLSIAQDAAQRRFLNAISLRPEQIIYLGKISNLNLNSVKGWYDDFKVRATTPTEEEICNYARGTLVAVHPQPSQNRSLYNLSRSYPLSSHKKIRALIAETKSSRFYACATKYYGNVARGERMISDNHMHLQQLPLGSTSVREKVLGIKNMLIFNQPRPDFSQNKFCLSCHTSENPNHELNLTALKRFPGTVLQLDARRQPMQPPANLQGNIPKNYFKNGLPNRAVTSSSPHYVDQYLHPERTSLTLKWNSVEGHVYSLAVMDTLTKVVTGACVSASRLGTNTEFSFTGHCTGNSTVSVPLTHETQVRVCAAPRGSWGSVNPKCSDFVPLNYHENGQLHLQINP